MSGTLDPESSKIAPLLIGDRQRAPRPPPAWTLPFSPGPFALGAGSLVCTGIEPGRKLQLYQFRANVPTPAVLSGSDAPEPGAVRDLLPADKGVFVLTPQTVYLVR